MSFSNPAWGKVRLPGCGHQESILTTALSCLAVPWCCQTLCQTYQRPCFFLPAGEHPQEGLILALASTLAGNLLLIGSVANLIVVGQAGRLGYRIGWMEHMRYGIPVTFATLAFSAAWIILVS